MTRTLLVTLLLALLAAPVALAQHGPPPGYTDPTEYAADYAARQAEQAQADPVGYASSRDPAAEAEHAAWLACWEAYEAAGHAVDAACSAYFTAPVAVEPAVQEATAEVTETLNATGASALAAEALDAVGDTVDDPTTALDQVQRVVSAAVRFVKDLLGFAKDTLTMLGLGVAAGVIGAVEGLIDLSSLPVRGLDVALSGLLSTLGLAGGAAATASSTVGSGVLGAAQAIADAVATVVTTAADGVGAALGAVGSGIAAAGGAVADGAHAVGSGIQDAADAVHDGVSSALDKVAGLFDGKDKPAGRATKDLPKAPKTGTGADGLVDRVLGSL